MGEQLQHNEWSGKTDGLPWMQRSLIFMFRIFPLWLVYGIMALVVPFYMLFGKGYKASYRLYRDRFGYGALKSFVYTYTNHFRFGQVILDRFGVYGGKRYDFIKEGQDIMDDLEKREEGFIVLSCHVGNYEIAGYSLRPKAKRFNALVYGGETATVMENRQRLLAQNNMRLILVKEDLSHMFELNAAIENGEIVSIPADRILGSQKYVECDFLGAKAHFPMGAFALAVSKNLPVLAVFVMKEGLRKYHAYVSIVDCNRQLGRQEQIVQMAQDYVGKIEGTLRRYPTQWFNFYDFWRQ